MIEELKNIKSGKNELRQFGIAAGTVMAVWAGFFFLRQKDYYLYFFWPGLILLFLGLAWPAPLKPLQKIWMGLAVCIGWLTTRIILIILFYLVVTPIGILTRLFGKKSLDLNFNRNADSYWIARAAVSSDKSSYEQQF